MLMKPPSPPRYSLQLVSQTIHDTSGNGQSDMAAFLRGKQAGVQRDFSAGLDSSLFAIDDV